MNILSVVYKEMSQTHMDFSAPRDSMRTAGTALATRHVLLIFFPVSISVNKTQKPASFHSSTQNL